MKPKPLSFLFTLFVAVMLCAGIPAMAQRGQGHGGGHAGMSPGGASQSSHPEMNRDSNPRSTTVDKGEKKTAGELLAHNDRLSSKLQGLLPAGTNVQQAAGGFKNMGEFVAAVHVSHNLGIPFSDVKGKMMTGESLGKAVHELDPKVDAKAETKKAERQAKETINSSAN